MLLPCIHFCAHLTFVWIIDMQLENWKFSCEFARTFVKRSSIDESGITFVMRIKTREKSKRDANFMLSINHFARFHKGLDTSAIHLRWQKKYNQFWKQEICFSFARLCFWCANILSNVNEIVCMCIAYSIWHIGDGGSNNSPIINWNRTVCKMTFINLSLGFGFFFVIFGVKSIVNAHRNTYTHHLNKTHLICLLLGLRLSCQARQMCKYLFNVWQR